MCTYVCTIYHRESAAHRINLFYSPPPSLWLSSLLLLSKDRKTSTMTLTDIVPKPKKSDNTKSVLRWAALFLGELRDGLTMVSSSLLFLNLHLIEIDEDLYSSSPIAPTNVAPCLSFQNFPVHPDQHAKRILDCCKRVYRETSRCFVLYLWNVPVPCPGSSWILV